MSEFHGQFEHSVDAKARITVPAIWRDQLSEGVVLAKGLDASVWVFTPEGYDKFSDGFLKQASPLDKRGRMLRRRFHGSRFPDKVDSAGRIRVPAALGTFAKVAEGPCVMVGAEDWFELWNPERWAAYDEASNAELDEMAENFDENVN